MKKMMLVLLAAALGACGGMEPEEQLDPMGGKADGSDIDLLRLRVGLAGTHTTALLAKAMRQGLPGKCEMLKLESRKVTTTSTGELKVWDFWAYFGSGDRQHAIIFQHRFADGCTSDADGTRHCVYKEGDWLSSYQLHATITPHGSLAALESYYTAFGKKRNVISCR